MTKTSDLPVEESTEIPDATIVVGVDGSVHNEAAVAWAAAEADRAGTACKLLTVVGRQDKQQPPYSAIPLPLQPVDLAHGLLNVWAEKIRERHPKLEVTTDVVIDDARDALVSASRRASMVVVGKRGLGAFKRMMLGSTSIELAGRAASPVVVVPDAWTPVSDDQRSILVGLDIRHESDVLLRFAFERADELGVPLIAVHVWSVHPLVDVSADDRDALCNASEQAVAAALAPWSQKYPRVEAIAAQRQAQAAEGLLDAAQASQLLLVGRHNAGRPHIGLGVGSAARGVMHAAELPVAVVPTS